MSENLSLAKRLSVALTIAEISKLAQIMNRI